MKVRINHHIDRLLQLGLIILLQCLYLPLNRNLSGGTLTHIWLDDFVPILPAWTIPYVLWLPVCLIFAVWAALKMPENLFRAYFPAALFTTSTSMLFFWLYPTYVLRPDIVDSDIFSQMLRLVYKNDQLYNAFPSGHVYLVVSTALFYLCWYSSGDGTLRTIHWNSWRPWFWIGLVIVVCLSTVFTGQHSLIDIPGGTLVAILGYYFGRWWANRSSPEGVYETQSTK
ncbi:MAG: phosphatase PAP2 family protein [Anaerolineaceae bacterium]